MGQMAKPSLRSEHEDQCIVVSALRRGGVGVFAVPNGAYLGRFRHAAIRRLRAEGLTPGAPDLILESLTGAPGRPVCVEMKRRVGYHPSPEQIAMRARLEASGWVYVLGRGWVDALTQLVDLGLTVGIPGHE